MSEGTAVRTTMRPLTSPTTTPKASVAAMPSQIGRPIMPANHRRHHGAGGHHGADRNVQLACDHQQADGNGDDAEAGGDVEPARHARQS